MRSLCSLLGLVLAASACLAQEPAPVRQPVREGNLERLTLDGGTVTDVAAWEPAEATVTASDKHARRGPTALLLHIPVDWKTGEPNYPVGWPRMKRQFPAGVTDWSAWDYLELSVYAESSRASLPAMPLGLEVYGGGSRADYERPLSELKLGHWTDYRLPINSLPSANPRTAMQFYISESDYRDGDVLDFWIDGISLVRYVTPTLIASRPTEQVLFSDSRYLLVDVDMMGAKPGEQAGVAWMLTRAGETAAQGRLSVCRGKSRLALPLPAQVLAPGHYQLVLKCQGESPPPYPLTVASSPWQEGSR